MDTKTLKLDERLMALPNLWKLLFHFSVLHYPNLRYSKTGEDMKLKCVGEGSSRIVYSLNDTHVLKVGNRKYGIGLSMEANFMEYLISKRFPRLPLAKCQMYFDGDIPLIVMEKVEPINENTPMRSLRGFCDGDTQLGRTMKGRRVSYDYGYEFEFLMRNGGSAIDFSEEETQDLMDMNPKLEDCPNILVPQYMSLTI
jgi:hypothetical protein